MAPNPFLSMLTECKLNLENFKDWKRNLLMVLAVEKHKYVLDTPRPQRPKEDDPDSTSAYNKWMESDEIARIYMMASMPKNLQMQHEAYKTSAEIMENLEDMFGGQEDLARQNAITKLMTCRMQEGTPVKNHVLTMMGYFAEASDCGAELDYNTQISMLFESLPKTFAGFRAAYNLSGKNLDLTRMMKELRAYEAALGMSVKAEAHLAIASSSRKIQKKRRKQPKKSAPKLTGQAPHKSKDTKRKRPVKLDKIKCFECGEKGHMRRDCKKFLDRKEANKDGKELLYLEVCLVEDSDDTWVIDSGATNHVCFSMQGLEETRSLASNEVSLRTGDGSLVLAEAIGNV